MVINLKIQNTTLYSSHNTIESIRETQQKTSQKENNIDTKSFGPLAYAIQIPNYFGQGLK